MLAVLNTLSQPVQTIAPLALSPTPHTKLVGDVKEPTSLFKKIRGRSPRCCDLFTCIHGWVGGVRSLMVSSHCWVGSCLLPLSRNGSWCTTFHMKMFFHMFILVQIQLVSIWMVEHHDSFWNRGKRQLGNGDDGNEAAPHRSRLPFSHHSM